MHPVSYIAIVMGALGMYLLVAGIVLHELRRRDRRTYDEVLFFMAILWPVSLPVKAVIALVVGIANRMDEERRRREKAGR